MIEIKWMSYSNNILNAQRRVYENQQTKGKFICWIPKLQIITLVWWRESNSSSSKVYKISHQKISNRKKAPSNKYHTKIVRALTFQSSVVTSLLFSFVLGFTCFNTNVLEVLLCDVDWLLSSLTLHIRAVESPDLVASE